MSAPDPFKARTLKRKNVKGLALNAVAPKAPAPSDGDAQIPGAVGNRESNRDDTLEIGLEFRLDLKSEDLVVLKELGAGNGGTVSKVMHAGTKVVMARKVIRVDAKETVRKQIVRELQVGHDCNNPNIVIFYGAFQNEARDIVLCMEYMDSGSLDAISKNFGPVRVDVLGKIAEAVLGGLVYLYEAHRIMHRDIKPSNVLVNSRGQIKLCDFGVAGETVNSLANTFVGTSTYMAPERIQGGVYSVKSDVWSVGLTIMELAVGRFPFDSSESAAGDRASAGPMGILDLLQTIVHEPAPKLPRSDAFPPILDDFIAKCLLKNPDERPTPRELYDKDAFLQAAKRTPVNLEEWAISMMERHNRKSYLAPPAPKSIDKEGHDSSARSPIEIPSARPRQTPTTSEVSSIANSSTTPRQPTSRTPITNTHSHNSSASSQSSGQPGSARSTSSYSGRQGPPHPSYPSYPSRDPRANFPNPNDRRHMTRSPHAQAQQSSSSTHNSDSSAHSTPHSASHEHLALENGTPRGPSSSTTTPTFNPPSSISSPYERPNSTGPRPPRPPNPSLNLSYNASPYQTLYPKEPVSAIEPGPGSTASGLPLHNAPSLNPNAAGPGSSSGTIRDANGRPYFPPRTSSSSALHTRASNPNLDRAGSGSTVPTLSSVNGGPASSGGGITMTLPIRAAPPPSGPLPPPPQAMGMNGSGRRGNGFMRG